MINVFGRLLACLFASTQVCALANADIQSNPSSRPQARADLVVKRHAIDALEAKAKAVTGRIGDLAKSGNLPTSDEGVVLLKKLVDELSEIKDDLKAARAQIDGIQAYVDGEKKTLPALETKVDTMQRLKVLGYEQFQYRRGDEPTKQQSGFYVRRARLGAIYQIDDRTSIKILEEFASGASQSAGELKEGWMAYQFVPTKVNGGVGGVAGQLPLPLGYEVPRSTPDLEFPERSIYARRLFNGEDVRGISARAGLGSGVFAVAGLFDALTIDDPEQVSIGAGSHGRLVGAGGLRKTGKHYDFGLTGLAGKRPSYQSGSSTSPETDRRFVYIDGYYGGLLKGRAYVRAEGMKGKDRVPTAAASPSATATDLSGWHVQAGYWLDPKNQLSLRYEAFDPNVHSAPNAAHGYGAAFIHYLNPNASLRLSQEQYFDNLRSPSRYNVTTLRVQFKF